MIAANKIQRYAEAAFAGRAKLRTGVSDDHQCGRCGGALRSMYGTAVLLRGR